MTRQPINDDQGDPQMNTSPFSASTNKFAYAQAFAGTSTRRRARLSLRSRRNRKSA